MKNFTKVFSLTALLFLCISYASFSQINFGARVGLNMADVAGVNTNAHFKPGPHLGGYVRIGSEKFSFQPEVLLSMKGYQFKASYSEKQSLTYIDIPLMFRLGKSFAWNFGVQPSFLLGAKYKYKYLTTETSTANKSSFNSVDVGILTGFEYELGSGLNFGVRFAFGLLPIFQSSLYKKVINLNGQFTIGYTIGKD
jgi:hypothetical protein